MSARKLEINVLGGRKLKETEFFGIQDPYVVFMCGLQKLTTNTCHNGGQNPKFNDKCVVFLSQGEQEISMEVWNKNSVRSDDLIGTGKILLDKVLASGYDDRSWPLTTKKGKDAGELKVILHCEGVGNQNAFGKAASDAPPVPQPVVPKPPNQEKEETAKGTSSMSVIGSALKKIVKGRKDKNEGARSEGKGESHEKGEQEGEGEEEEEEEEESEESEESEEESEEDEE